MKLLKICSFLFALLFSSQVIAQGAVLRGEEAAGVYKNLSSVNGVLQMSGSGYSFNNIKTSTTTVIKSGAGQLHCLTINNIGTTWVITIFDNIVASGTTIATTTALTILGAYCFDIAFTTGLTIVTSGVTAGDITISYR